MMNKVWYVSYYYDDRTSELVVSFSRMYSDQEGTRRRIREGTRRYINPSRFSLFRMKEAVKKKVKDDGWQKEPSDYFAGWAAYGNMLDEWTAYYHGLS